MSVTFADGTGYHSDCVVAWSRANRPSQPDCPCIDRTNDPHWREDKFGNEYRIDCGCPCDRCSEY